MKPGRVLTSFAGIRTGSKFIHGQTDGFVRFLAQCTETHGSSHEMLHNLAGGFNLVDGDGILAETHEVADKDWGFFPISSSGKFLELCIVACTGRQLKHGNGLRIPGMFDAISAPMELSVVGQSHFRITNRSI